MPGGSAHIIDGNLNEPIWQGIVPLEPFVLVGSPDAPANGQTTARATWDTKAIYIAFRCDEPNPDQLQSEKLAPNDMGIFRGNVAEIYINPTRSDSMFFHFAINSSGSFWAANHIKDKPELLTQSWEHATNLEQNGWTAEIAIPWSMVGLSGPPGAAPTTSASDTYAPRPAPPFRVNLARGRPQAGEYSAWSAVAKSFLETGNFGTWKFK
jgi:hypothetical protein